MHVQLDYRSAIGKTNAAFRRFPLWFGGPLFMLGSLNFGFLRIFSTHASSLRAALSMLWSLVVLTVVTYLLEVLLSAQMWNVQLGISPGVEGLWAVTRYPGLYKYLGRLMVRYIGWGCLLGFGTLVIGFLYMFFGRLVLGAFPRHGIGAEAGSGHLFVPLFMISLAVALSRYQLALPVFALERGVGVELLDQSVVRAKAVWGTVSVIALLEYAPTILHSLLATWLRIRLPSIHGLLPVLQFIFMVSCQLWFAWFVVFKTALTRQVLEQIPLERVSLALEGEGT